MRNDTPFAGVACLLAAALLAASCRDAVAPGHEAVPTPEAAITTGMRPALDQFNGTFSQSGTHVIKGFNPTNPHVGSAIVATFLWSGSSNIITAVTDHLTNGTPVGNTYTLVEYVTAGGLSMATYVATNVQNFPDPNANQEEVLVVDATLSASVTHAGVIISAYRGVESVATQALGAHRSATGAAASTAAVGPGTIAVEAGALVYGVTLSNGVTGIDGPGGYTGVATMADASLKADARYALQGDSGQADPEWTWFFNSQSSWLATVLTLHPAPGQTLILDGTLNESGETLSQGFYPTNPHVGDAVIATFVWLGATNIITAVTDQLSNGTPVGNTYTLVEYVTAGGISMATYVATNVREFPDPNPSSDEVLVVEAQLSEPVTDGGVMLSAYSGVQPSYQQALGAHRSAGGAGSSETIAGTGGIPVGAGALVYAITLSNGVVGVAGPDGFTNITTMSDTWLKSDGQYAVRDTAGSVDPQWIWYFDSTSTWIASALSLNPR